MIDPPAWTEAELDQSRQKAEEHFRQGRHTEPLEIYLELFDEYQSVVEDFIEQTVDLRQIDAHALDLLTDQRKHEVFRYLSGPPISEDDLKVLMQAKSISPARLRRDRALLDRMVAFMRDWHDRRRFPWIVQDWEQQNRTGTLRSWPRRPY